jgi:hypothetical protein
MGNSSEEISTAVTQLFLNCPAVRPDEAGQEMNADEFEHTEVEQQARRDQLRVLVALARHDQQHGPATIHAKKDAPTPTQALAAEEHAEPLNFQGPIGSRAPLMEMVQFCVETGVVTNGVTASSAEKDEPKVTTEGSDGSRALQLPHRCTRIGDRASGRNRSLQPPYANEQHRGCKSTLHYPYMPSLVPARRRDQMLLRRPAAPPPE